MCVAHNYVNISMIKEVFPSIKKWIVYNYTIVFVYFIYYVFLYRCSVGTNATIPEQDEDEEEEYCGLKRFPWSVQFHIMHNNMSRGMMSNLYCHLRLGVEFTCLITRI